MRATRLIFILSTITVSLFSSRGADHSSNSPAAQDLKRFQLAAGFKAELLASEPLLQNPVAFSIDGRSRFFVAETHRWNHSIFDITQNTPWLLDDLSLRTVNDRAAFLARVFATNLSVLTTNSELIRLVEDRDGDGQAETSSIFAHGFDETTSGTAAGVLAQGTNVWFTSIPDLWRFPAPVAADLRRLAPSASTNRDLSLGTAAPAKRERLATGLGVHISVSGHDVHGLIRGHDGRIYFSFGDRGVNVTNRESAVLNVPDTGGVLRCEPDGRNLEIFCIGLRNPQELAFDDYGNLWTVDNDTAGADPCRVLHLVEGGDYGWRASYQHMKGFGPWVQEELWRGGLDGILPPAGTVSQGPAGLAFYPGTGATPQLAGRFVHADFPGGIWAFSVKPRGGSFEIAGKEKLLWNCWPTDVEFGPDGALYVLDWVQGWGPPGKGRIYRLTSTNNVNAREIAEVQSLLRDGMTKRGEKELLALLGHKDRRVRLEAQWELATRGEAMFPALRKAAFDAKSPMARLHALWAIEQIARRIDMGRSGGDLSDELVELVPLMDDHDEVVAGEAARVLGATQLLNANPAIAALTSNTPPRLRFQAAMAYGTLMNTYHRASRSSAQKSVLWLKDKFPGAGRLGEKLVNTSFTFYPGWDAVAGYLQTNQFKDRFLDHAGVRHWQRLEKLESEWSSYRGLSWSLAVRATNSSAAVRNAAALTLRHWTNAFVTNLLADADAHVALTAARAINDAPIPDACPALAALLDDPRFRDSNWGRSALSNITPAGPFSANVRSPREQVLRRALNANFRLGDAKNAAALVRFALGTPVSDPAHANQSIEPAGLATGSPDAGQLRAEALFLVGAWEVLPAKVGDLPIKPAKDPNHGSVPTVNPENWPGWFDRVVGLWRPLPPRPPDDARHALAPHIATLLSAPAAAIAPAALDAAVRLHLTNASPALLARLHDRAAPVSLRVKVPSALAALRAAELGDAIKFALEDSNTELRTAALPYLGRLGGDRAARILGGIVAAAAGVPSAAMSSDLRLAQAALIALGNLPTPAADDFLRPALTNLLAGTLPAALELDLIEAASHRDSPEIKALLARRETALPQTDELAPSRMVLRGGDAGRGRIIFFEKTEVQCSRCHQVKGEGGIVGPALDGVGKRQSREYLLESIMQPNKSIARGFENILITLKNGASHAGQVKAESDLELELNSPEDGMVKLRKPDIQSRTRGLSAMPEGLGPLLSKRELRDLIEFLASLQ